MKTFSEIYIKLESRGESIILPLESPNWEYVKMELPGPCPQPCRGSHCIVCKKRSRDGKGMEERKRDEAEGMSWRRDKRGERWERGWGERLGGVGD